MHPRAVQPARVPLGSKRARPLGYAEGAGSREPSAKVPKEDTAAIYEATLNKLRLGARTAAANASSCSGEGKQHDCKSGRISNGVACFSRPQIQGLVGLMPDLRVSIAGLTNLSATTIATSTSTSTSTASLPPARCEGRGGARPCYVCMSRVSVKVCFHCSRGCCMHCSRRCDGCQELFCSICSTLNYNERYDRSFCFDCNTKASLDHSNLPLRSTSNDDMEFL